MSRRWSFFGLLLTLAGCAVPLPNPVFTEPDVPLTRLVTRAPVDVLNSGSAALRAMGFEIAPPAEGATRIYSQPMTVQYSWRGAPVGDRILCGLGTTGSSELERVVQLSNEIPIQLQVGYEVEQRSEGVAASILFGALGIRTPLQPLLPAPGVACSLSGEFVSELFDALEAPSASDVLGPETALPPGR